MRSVNEETPTVAAELLCASLVFDLPSLSLMLQSLQSKWKGEFDNLKFQEGPKSCPGQPRRCCCGTRRRQSSPKARQNSLPFFAAARLSLSPQIIRHPDLEFLREDRLVSHCCSGSVCCRISYAFFIFSFFVLIFRGYFPPFAEIGQVFCCTSEGWRRRFINSPTAACCACSCKGCKRWR